MSQERPPLFDHRAARAARLRARRMPGERFLDQAALEGLIDRLGTVKRRFEHGLWIGEELPSALETFAGRWSLAEFDAREVLRADGGPFDLGLSLYSLQTLNDLPGALIQIRRMLKSDGLFLGALFGGATLAELRESFAYAESETQGGISPRVVPFADVRDLGGLLQRAGFALPVADVERLSVRYANLSKLVEDLRRHGQTNVLSERRKNFLRRDTFDLLQSHYAARHSEGGRLTATFETVYLAGWAPHPDQQKPLKPGSAKSRLSDALGTVERKI
jgi:SAM-dependent methyltransferase